MNVICIVNVATKLNQSYKPSHSMPKEQSIFIPKDPINIFHHSQTVADTDFGDTKALNEANDNEEKDKESENEEALPEENFVKRARLAKKSSRLSRAYQRLLKRTVKKSADQIRARREKSIPFTYSDPRTYVGPIVQGWPPYADRNLSRYIRPDKDTFPIQPKGIEKASAQILFLVHSTPENFSMRDGVRKSWFSFGSDRVDNMTALFILGLHKDPDINQKVQDEANQFDDIVQADFKDHYNNLTLKSMFCLKYLLKTNWVKQPEILFKVDDDSFVNVEALENLLANRTNKSEPWVLGHLLHDNPVPKKVPTSQKRRKFTSKWICPSYMFNGGLYPFTVSGAGYLMNLAAARCIYKEVLKLPFFHLEDVLITGFGAQNCNITLEHSSKIKTGPPEMEDLLPNDVLVHYVKSRSKNVLLKVTHFDSLQAKYNALLAQLGNQTKETPFTIVPNSYFESRAFREERMSAQYRRDMLRLKYRLDKNHNGTAQT
ncbi:uncharacterized protein LOC131882637 [Tigriopus californicus]|uniref:uncharacterized protein LOC131882637 n=1 Tax=Tigriopus californicus TaxID=6832 RepID=UPI0027DA6E59|nr:uncharacterized protein LOC131882637 [Tigriopus californicus]